MKNLLPALPVLLGFILDCIVGDPYNIPHPIKLIGSLISSLEKAVRKHIKNLRIGGIILAISVMTLSTFVPLAILLICYRVHVILGVVTETVMCCYMLAARCLCTESMKVCRAIENEPLESARKAVAMIVGRDTDKLDREGVIRAAVETVAENTSDGVTAPLFYMGLGGAIGAFFYKSVNTMDSMIGYKNTKYADIGRFAAKTDDLLNYIPSRISAVLMIVASYLCRYDSRNAVRIWKRDRRKHASPNSAQTESVCAGALHIQLAGDAWYFGSLHKKPYIGDNDRNIESDDIRRSNRLMYVTSVLMLIISITARSIIFGGLS